MSMSGLCRRVGTIDLVEELKTDVVGTNLSRVTFDVSRGWDSPARAYLALVRHLIGTSALVLVYGEPVSIA